MFYTRVQHSLLLCIFRLFTVVILEQSQRKELLTGWPLRSLEERFTPTQLTFGIIVCILNPTVYIATVIYIIIAIVIIMLYLHLIWFTMQECGGDSS